MAINNTVQRCDFRMHDIIDGKYRIVRVLNNTLNDQKFKVIDSEGKEYILKLLKLWEVDPRLRQPMCDRSESEINSCKINSCYLTNISKNGVVKGNPYVLVDFMQTTDLSKLLQGGHLDVVHVAKQILYGLHDLHKCGKVHCSLMPENILVTKDNQILLTNYIILGDRSKTVLSQMHKASRNPRMAKALGYASPEFFQLQKNATILPTSDIYSFGVILFQMLTGELPFGQITTEADWLRYQGRIIAGDWNKNLIPRGTERNIWVEILDGCLCADPANRFDDVDDILKRMPTSDLKYLSLEGSLSNVPAQMQNGVMLRQMQGDEFGEKYRLQDLFVSGKHIITIGRADEEVYNSLSLKEASSNYISRRHCTIEWDEGTDVWYIRDGQWEKGRAESWHRSLNGTYVNAKEIDEEGHALKIGDIISLGDIRLRFEGF